MNGIADIQCKDLNTSLPLTIAGGWTNLFIYRVPAKQVLKITHFSNYMETEDWGKVEWRIMKNSVPCYPYESILDHIGISSLPRSIEHIIFQGGDELRIDARLLAAAADPNDIGIALKYEVM